MCKEGDTVFGMPFLCAAVCAAALALSLSGDVLAQSRKADALGHAEDERASLGQSLNFTEQLLARKIDEQMLFQALSELAQVDKVRYTGPPCAAVRR